MNLANKITTGRILLIPLLIAASLAYGQTSPPHEPWRYLTAAIFLLSSVADGVDGYIARRLHQETWLGRLLDPIADKGLMLAALLTVCLSWPPGMGFPLWFPVLVILRDSCCVAAAFLIRRLTGSVRIIPHWTGKLTTITQIIAIGWVMLQFSSLLPIPAVIPVGLAAACTVISGMVYLHDCIRQIGTAPANSATLEPPPSG